MLLAWLLHYLRSAGSSDCIYAEKTTFINATELTVALFSCLFIGRVSRIPPKVQKQPLSESSVLGEGCCHWYLGWFVNCSPWHVCETGITPLIWCPSSNEAEEGLRFCSQLNILHICGKFQELTL